MTIKPSFCETLMTKHGHLFKDAKLISRQAEVRKLSRGYLILYVPHKM
jgi:hypothetical protein